MSDRDLRALERAAAAGDPAARRRLATERLRAGLLRPREGWITLRRPFPVRPPYPVAEDEVVRVPDPDRVLTFVYLVAGGREGALLLFSDTPAHCYPLPAIQIGAGSDWADEPEISDPPSASLAGRWVLHVSNGPDGGVRHVGRRADLERLRGVLERAGITARVFWTTDDVSGVPELPPDALS